MYIYLSKKNALAIKDIDLQQERLKNNSIYPLCPVDVFIS